MKSHITLIASFVFGASSFAAEVKTLFPQTTSNTAVSESAVIPDGSVAEIVTAYGDTKSGGTATVFVSNAGKTAPYILSLGGTSYSQEFKNSSLTTVRGPATITAEAKGALNASNPARALVTIKVLTEAEYLSGGVSIQPSTSVPSNSVVIPEDATGPVTILLESSTDLITWTSALPGSYGQSTVKRFFRVRAVANP